MVVLARCSILVTIITRYQYSVYYVCPSIYRTVIVFALETILQPDRTVGELIDERNQHLVRGKIVFPVLDVQMDTEELVESVATGVSQLKNIRFVGPARLPSSIIYMYFVPGQLSTTPMQVQVG